MIKIILLVLMALMIATPCFAQDVEPNGIFSLHGTVWETLPMGVQILPSPSLVSLDWEFNFYGGEVYNLRSPSFYIDMLVCSIFWGVRGGKGGGYPPVYFGILQPIGIGMVIQYNVAPFPIKDLTIGLVIKTDNNWKPPEFVSIFPNKGEQGTTLTDVTIIGANTNFESGVDAVLFLLGYGTVISNIRVVSNTEIKFDLEIATDAAIGFIDIIVWYDDSKESIYEPDVFEVLPKTN